MRGDRTNVAPGAGLSVCILGSARKSGYFCQPMVSGRGVAKMVAPTLARPFLTA